MEKIGVYGSGVIGACEATLSIGNGFETVVVGHSAAGLARCRAAIEKNWDDLIAQHLAAERNKAAALRLLTVTDDPGALSERTFVFEAVAEDLGVKRTVYAAVEAHCAPDTIIASCTSSLTAAALAVLVKRPERLVIAHPFQPAHMLPLVELVPNEKTAPAVLVRARELLEGCLDRQVVLLRRDVPGLLVNRLAQAMFRESLFLIEQGVTTAEDIDKAVKWAVGKRYASIGLLEYFDEVGFPLERDIAANVYPSLCDAKEIQDIVKRGLSDGKTGVAAGEGLYDWSKKDVAEFRMRKQAPYFENLNWALPE
ncbi:MAG: 3-hydroxyacyl-CoA dehydrogenase family protein [Pseudoflavonifractor sp.]|nr:3-hydroxyacyl-CoA dehydrogenase family protein [Pseudoflavonifractor sp.]